MNEKLFRQEDLYAIAMNQNIKEQGHRMNYIGDLRKASVTNYKHASINQKLSFAILAYLLNNRSIEINDIHSIKHMKNASFKIIAGKYIDGIGSLNFACSPLWLMTITTEAVGGDNKYADLLVQSLKRHELIEADYEGGQVQDLIDKLNGDLMTPGVIKANDLVKFTRDLNQVHQLKKLHVFHDKMAILWQRMEKVTIQQRISMDQLLGIMTLDLIEALIKTKHNKVKLTVYDMVNAYDTIVEVNYYKSISRVSELGKGLSVISHMTPFIKYYATERNAKYKS